MTVFAPRLRPAALVPDGLVERLAGARVLCLGDLMLDRYVFGRVERVSPEAPIPVLRVDREDSMLGGAGNVARNLAALGARTLFVAMIGRDAHGAAVTSLIGEETAIEPYLVHAADRATTVKTRFLAGGHQLLRTDHESASPPPAETEAKLADLAEAALGDVGAVVLSDYGKGVLTPSVLGRVIAAAQARGLPVIVDPKGRDFTRYRGATLITPNRAELGDAADMPCRDDAEIVAAARGVIAQCGIAAVLATRSEDGASLVTAAGVDHLSAESREVYDVSGAGDTVVATLAAGLAAGARPLEAAALAIAAASVVVGKIGAAVARPDEIAEALAQGGSARPHDRVATRGAAAERVALWRKRGLKIGFTNGCFDLLHPGHIALLAQARAACDRLVVGLNDDASVRRLKGETRPIRPLQARADVLAALGDVDLVTPFEEDTPEALIQRLRPDVLVKGEDYTIEQVVGAAFVQSYGGRVLLATLTPGESTTAIAHKAGAV